MILRINSFLIFALLCLFISGCTVQSPDSCKVLIEAENAYNQTLYLDNIPGEHEPVTHLDSIAIKDRLENIVFTIPKSEEGLYRIYTKDHRVEIVFINDEPEIKLYLNYLDNGNFIFNKSNANISLQQFLASVRQKAAAARSIVDTGAASTKVADSLFFAMQQDYRNYVDSVASPAAALYIYNNVDFGSDRKELRKFITRLSKKFPGHKRIQDLLKRTDSYLEIFEKELEVGNTAPELVLPANSGEIVTLSSFKGRYVLVDFWASWDQPSKNQEKFNEMAYSKWGGRNFSIVSVSLEPEREVWKQYLQTANYKWTQLIDEQVWMGPAVKAYKFDSIPFNFLIDPSGKIIGKAMYGDSLLKKLDQVIK